MQVPSSLVRPRAVSVMKPAVCMSFATMSCCREAGLGFRSSNRDCRRQNWDAEAPCVPSRSGVAGKPSNASKTLKGTKSNMPRNCPSLESSLSDVRRNFDCVLVIESRSGDVVQKICKRTHPAASSCWSMHCDEGDEAMMDNTSTGSLL
ncbi:hypothetical protein BDZ45DRAFT_696517 [Acephala macrosclerotiorum]|nr:hypothetical protein BDZ45DRAFT_696517 [Acephala macrosclerotiorum]